MYKSNFEEFFVVKNFLFTVRVSPSAFYVNVCFVQQTYIRINTLIFITSATRLAIRLMNYEKVPPPIVFVSSSEVVCLDSFC